MTAITGKITTPTGDPLPNVQVRATLRPRPAFETATGTEISPVAAVITDMNGEYTFDLVPTEDITPENSFYEISEDIPGMPLRHIIQVGDTPSTVYASLVTAPSPGAVQALTLQAADARYVQSPGSFGTSTSTSYPNYPASAGVLDSYSRSDHRHKRETTYGSAAKRMDLSGEDLYEGLTFRETDTGRRLFTRRGGAWLQVSDTIICTSSTRPASPYEGMRIFETDTGRILTHNGAAWWTIGRANAESASHTTQVEQAGNRASTTNISRLRVIDGVCEWWFQVTIGATGSAGNAVFFTLPVASAVPAPGHIGAGQFFRAGASTVYVVSFEVASPTSKVGMVASTGGTNNLLGATPSFAVAPGDEIRGHVRYLVSAAS